MVMVVIIVVIIIIAPRDGHRHGDAPGHVRAHQRYQQQTDFSTVGASKYPILRRGIPDSWL